MSHWTYLDHNKYLRPRLDFDKDNRAIKVYPSMYSVPDAFRGSVREGRYRVDFRYLGPDEHVVSTPEKYMVIYTGSRSGRVWEIDINLEAVQELVRKVSKTPIEIALKNVTIVSVKHLMDRRSRTKHYETILEVIRKEYEEIFSEVIPRLAS